jgi:hypothetical protein
LPGVPDPGKSVAFEILHGALVLLGFGAGFESPQISSLSGLWIFLSRVEAIPAGL